MAKSRVVGLDIGTTAVRAAEVSFGRGGPAGTAQPTLHAFAEVQLPPGAVLDAEVVEPETVASSLKALWKAGKFSTKDVVLGVGNTRVVVRELDLPWMPMAQLRASLPYQVQELLPMPVENALLDFYPTGSFDAASGRQVRGMLVAASRDSVNSTVMAAESAGLRPQMVDLNAFALQRTLARGAMAHQVIAIVDVGARVTNVVIADQGIPRLIRMLPTGGQDATDAVAGQLQVSAPEADAIKRDVGFGYSVPAELSNAAAAIAEVTTGLIEGVRNTFAYYSSNYPGAPISNVFVTGGGAQLPGLGQYLATASRLPVSLAEPLSGFKVTGSARNSLPPTSSTIAVPLGLAFGVAA